MATRKSARKQSKGKRTVPYDMSNINNWYADQFREKLAEWNIYVPSTYSKAELKSLYMENLSHRSNTQRQNETVTVPDLEITSNNTLCSTNPVNVSATTEDSQLLNFMTTITNLVTKVVDKNEIQDQTQNTLDKFCMPSGSMNFSDKSGPYGLHPESVGQLDYVSDSVRTKILEGKYVNLASLLIPEYELIKESKAKKDPRLEKNLTIEEFIIAFHKYKRIHCRRYPWRKPELDQYEANMVEISRMYGQKFYEYHKIFSQRCAAALAVGIKVSWADKDKELLQMIIGGTHVNSCSICKEVTHTTPFCPKHAYPTYNTYKPQYNLNSFEQQSVKKDLMHNSVPICTYFNANGCKRLQCSFAHVCKICKSTTHGVKNCAQYSIPTIQQSNGVKPKPKQSFKSN